MALASVLEMEEMGYVLEGPPAQVLALFEGSPSAVSTFFDSWLPLIFLTVTEARYTNGREGGSEGKLRTFCES